MWKDWRLGPRGATASSFRREGSSGAGSGRRRPRAAVVMALALLVTMVVLAARARADDRMPAPDAAAIAKARQLVDTIYRDEIAAAKTRPAQLALAKTLLERSRKPGTEVATCYVLLSLSDDTARSAGDVEGALDAAGGLARLLPVAPARRPGRPAA